MIHSLRWFVCLKPTFLICFDDKIYERIHIRLLEYVKVDERAGAEGHVPGLGLCLSVWRRAVYATGIGILVRGGGGLYTHYYTKIQSNISKWC